MKWQSHWEQLHGTGNISQCVLGTRRVVERVYRTFYNLSNGIADKVCMP